MKYLEFKNKLREFIIISTQEIKKIDTSSHYLRRIYEWKEKGYLKKIIRGYYIFSDLDLNEETLFIISNKIYRPSYISFEMALSYYNLIPESIYGLTAATSKKTASFHTPIGKFIYRSIKPNLMFGYKLIRYKNQAYLIAELEKAIIDFFYLRVELRTEEDFFELRINSNELLKQINITRFKKYLSIYKNKKLEERVQRFMRYIKNA